MSKLLLIGLNDIDNTPVNVCIPHIYILRAAHHPNKWVWPSKLWVKQVAYIDSCPIFT